MPDSAPSLRIVGDGETPPRRPRSPGPAVVLVALYALVFGAALWWMRGQVRHAGRPAPRASQPAPAHVPVSAPAPLDRRALLSGSGLAPAERSDYARQLATACCDCGCDLTLQECLIGDQKCARSAAAAQERLERLR